MPAIDFHHGVQVISAGETPRSVSLANMRPIGAIMVAPNANPDIFPINEPVAFFSDDSAKKAAAGFGGNVADIFDAIEDQGTICELVVVRVAEGAGENAQAKLESTITNIAGTSSNLTGLHAFKGSESHTGTKPRLFIAPGFTDMRIQNAANPVVSELKGIADRLKGMIIADVDASSKEAAYDWVKDFSASKRIYGITPFGKVYESGSYVTRPVSGRVAALFNKKWKEKGGPYFSPSNQIIQGIGGSSRPISYYDGELDHEANWLNQRGLATIIERTLLWGNRTLGFDPIAGTGDSNDCFVNVVITIDAIRESVAKAFRWAIDQNIGSHLGVAIVQQVDGFLGDLYHMGATVARGRCWFDREVNSISSLQSGIMRFDFSAEPSPPLEHLVFGVHRDPSAFDILANEILQQINSSASGG